MASVRRSQRCNLVDTLSKGTFHNAFLCTFSFDARFFEDYCLEKLDCLNSNGNITVLTDRAIYNQIALLPADQRPKQVNLRYLLVPIDVAGCFHSKLFLLTSSRTGRLIVGSANLTRAGLTTNAELVNLFDFELDEQETFLPLFQDAYQFLLLIAKRWPSEALISNLNELEQKTPWLTKASERAVHAPRLLHNLEKPLWGQIVSEVPRPIDRLSILSRFFDESPAILDQAIAEIAPKKVTIFTQNGLTTMTREWFNHPSVESGKTEVMSCFYEDEGHAQPLHAKALGFESKDNITLIYGSANFTRAALLSGPRNGNVETVMLVGGLAVEEIDTAELFDPNKSRRRLSTSQQLDSAARESAEIVGASQFQIAEATLVVDKLQVQVVKSETGELALSKARLQLGGDT